MFINKKRTSRVLAVVLTLCLLIGTLPFTCFAETTSAYITASKPSTSNNAANFYIYLDGEWICIGTLSFTVSSSWYNYTPTISTSAITTLINADLSDDHPIAYNDIALYCANNADFTNYTGYATIGSSSTTLSSFDYSNSTARKAKYIRVMEPGSNATSNAPLGFYTVTFDYETGTDEVFVVASGTSVALPNGITWRANGMTYSNGESVVITNTTTFVGYTTTHQITFINGDSTTTETVVLGTSYTLPALSDDYRWVCNGVSYKGGDVVVVDKDLEFVAMPRGKETLSVKYTVNFPTGSAGFFGTTFPASPTLIGTNSATSATDSIIEGANAITFDLTDRVPTSTSSSHGAQFQMAVYFSGWLTETGALISAGTLLYWSELKAYDADNDGDVELKGQWEYGTAEVANFCVRYDSKTGQSDTSTSRYTPSIYTTYVGGSGNVNWNGATDEEAYAVDKQIRALYGNLGGDLWLAEFPTDEYVFEQLKKYASNLTVEDKAVDPSELNSTKYAIRWYVFKKDASDGWHVDGRLVEKKGQITVSKNFYGEESVLQSAEKDFYIVATNGTKGSDNIFTPYSSSNSQFKQVVLTTNSENLTTLRSKYPNATFIEYTAAKSNVSTHYYKWIIPNVALGEQWQLTEFSPEIADSVCYSEYSAYDTDGHITALAAYGTVAEVEGKTFFLDEDATQGLLVDFRNYYYPEDSIFIKKEDGNTGLPLGGAAFELWQYDSNGNPVQMKFSYDADLGQYVYDSLGTITQIETAGVGYATVSTTGFSYIFGDVILKEVTFPTGYDPAPNVAIGVVDGNIDITGIQHEDGTPVDSENWDHYASLKENGSIIIIKNYTTAFTSITVNTVWGDSTVADNVTIALQAEGSIATTVVPGLTNAQIVLNADNGWTYTWENLPLYANGELIEWSVKEIKIGDDGTLEDNLSFANWTVVYAPAAKTDADGNGLPESLVFTITNSVRRTQLFITKTNLNGSTALSGAEFELTPVEWINGSWTATNSSITFFETSDAVGLVHFDNLIPGTYYQLREVSAPDGYLIGQESIVLTIDNSGQVVEVISGVASTKPLDTDYHVYTSPYNITIKNILQFNCSIVVPDTITFTFTGSSDTIWNPETTMYETSTSGSWDSTSEIYVTNLSAVNMYLNVEAYFVYEQNADAFADLDINISSPTPNFESYNGNDYSFLEGVLASDDTCTIQLEIVGTPIYSEDKNRIPIRIGTLTVKVIVPDGVS